MQIFDPNQIIVASGHFIAGLLVNGAADAAMEALRSSDGCAHA